MKQSHLSKDDLRKFGVLMGCACFVLGLILFFRKSWLWQFLWPISFTFFVIASIVPVRLRPVYSFWMKLAVVLGWINTRILLFLFFYLVLTPIGLLMRLFGKDFLDRKFEKEKASYWAKREPKDFDLTRYERQF